MLPDHRASPELRANVRSRRCPQKQITAVPACSRAVPRAFLRTIECLPPPPAARHTIPSLAHPVAPPEAGEAIDAAIMTLQQHLRNRRPSPPKLPSI